MTDIPLERIELERRVAGLADPYLRLADPAQRLISVFDDLRYDRADADMLSVGMRRRAAETLRTLGFRQVSGTVLEHGAANVRCLLPKFHALGASPFDAARYTPRRAEDYYLLTPTQSACMILDAHPLDDAVVRIEALIETQPINLYRMLDFLERKPAHEDFRKAFRRLERRQAEAVASEPLRRRRALG